MAFSSLQLHRLHTKNTTFAGSVSQRVPWPPARLQRLQVSLNAFHLHTIWLGAMTQQLTICSGVESSLPPKNAELRTGSIQSVRSRPRTLPQTPLKPRLYQVSLMAGVRAVRGDGRHYSAAYAERLTL